MRRKVPSDVNAIISPAAEVKLPHAEVELCFFHANFSISTTKNENKLSCEPSNVQLDQLLIDVKSRFPLSTKYHKSIFTSL
jgi:hypothetical protein